MARDRSPRAVALRVVRLLALAGVALFAVEGGEWGTSDLLRQRGRLARLRHDVDSLTRQVDSLAKFKTAVETDPAMQEKIAREEFGMVRGDRELLYRFVEGDTGRKGGGRSR